MKTLDKAYTDSLYEVSRQLKSAYEQISNNYIIDLTSLEITEAILLRLKAYYITQNSIKELLDKGYLAAASDFFVESVLFFTRIYLDQQGPIIKAVSEKEILIRRYINDEGKNRREIIRPDIAIYNGDHLMAIIECKTQLGRSRTSWESEYNIRKKKLNEVYPDAKMFLLVLTGVNWGGFDYNDNKLGQEYFCLLKDTWPTNYNDSSQILTGIEGILKQLH